MNCFLFCVQWFLRACGVLSRIRDVSACVDRSRLAPFWLVSLFWGISIIIQPLRVNIQKTCHHSCQNPTLFGNLNSVVPTWNDFGLNKKRWCFSSQVPSTKYHGFSLSHWGRDPSNAMCFQSHGDHFPNWNLKQRKSSEKWFLHVSTCFYWRSWFFSVVYRRSHHFFSVFKETGSQNQRILLICSASEGSHCCLAVPVGELPRMSRREKQH